LEAEGHAVIAKGKRYFVAGYESKLINVPKPRARAARASAS
jgi:hypothetical protein